MNRQPEYSDGRDSELYVDRPVVLSHLINTLYAYRSAIILAMLSVGIAYALSATLIYLFSPEQRTTSQPFRLEFRGATEGNLPNGIRFSATDIVSTPILLKVYNNNDLSRFVKFDDFSRSIYILESNREYEKLVTEYVARLSDPRLTPPDRDRIQKEFELKRESINKNDYSINYARTTETKTLPENVARKVLLDVLSEWANFAINSQHGLDYRVSVLSPKILDEAELEGNDAIRAIELLRARTYRVVLNIDQINDLPGALLMKTSDGMSLLEMRIRLEEIVRFRLEPLIGIARASGLVPNPAQTIQFLENELAYDERRLASARATVSAAKESLALYNNDQMAQPGSTTAPTTPARAAAPVAEGETVMPQLSDTFLDRLISLSKQATDTTYRQALIKRYQEAMAATIPIEAAVNYQQQVLNQMKSGAVSSGPRTDAATVRSEIASATNEVRQLILKVNEIYRLVSKNLNPSTQLFSLTGPPTTRIERTQTFKRLALYGIVVMLIALPLIVIFCLLHNRMREEQAEQSEETNSEVVQEVS